MNSGIVIPCPQAIYFSDFNRWCSMVGHRSSEQMLPVKVHLASGRSACSAARHWHCLTFPGRRTPCIGYSAKRVPLLGKRKAAFCRGWLLCVRHGLEDLLLRRHGFFADVESWPAVDSAFVGSKPRRSNWAGRGHPDGNRGRGAWQIGDGDGPGGASRSPIPDKSGTVPGTVPDWTSACAGRAAAL